MKRFPNKNVGRHNRSHNKDCRDINGDKTMGCRFNTIEAVYWNVFA